jgi:solute carrier family 25 (mitochondrial phosphate transporter), member 23/24/25/41
MPANHHGSGSALEAVLSFYSSVVTVNAEGDSLVSEEILEGLGTTTSFLLQVLFGSLLKLAKPDPTYLPRTPPTSPPLSDLESPQSETPSDENANASAEMATKNAPIRSAYGSASVAAATATAANVPLSGQVLAGTIQRPLSQFDGPEQSEMQDFSDLAKAIHEAVKTKLTDLLPEPGYFLAGAVSGGVSRTATAPLDRLKVFLLVNTKPPASAALGAVKHGHPLVAIKSAGGPIAEAIVSLWKAGGFRTFFAGKISSQKHAGGRC